MFSKVVRACRDLLDLHSFYTVGPKEARAWSISRGRKVVVKADVRRLEVSKKPLKWKTLTEILVNYDPFPAIANRL